MKTKKSLVCLIFLSILLLSSFTGIAFLSFPNVLNEYGSDSLSQEEINPVLEKNIAKKEQLNTISQTSAVTQSVDYNTWYLGESVNVTYQYPKSYSSNITDWTITDTTLDIKDSYTLMYVDDDTWHRIFIHDTGTPTEDLLVPAGYDKISEMVLYFSFDARTLGSLHFEVNCYGTWGGGYSSLSPPPSHTTEEVGLEYVDYYNDKVEIKVVVQSSAKHLAYIDNAFAIFIKNQENSSYVKLYEKDYTRYSGSIDANTFNDLRFRCDFLWYEPQQIISNLRPEFRYISSTQTVFVLDIPIYEYKTNVTIFLDATDEIEVEPEVSDLNYIYGRWTFKTIIPSDYHIKWFRNCTNLLTIKDVTADYLEDVGFENGRYQDDWEFRESDNQLGNQRSFNSCCE